MAELIKLKGQFGEEIEFELIATLKVENTDYAILHHIVNDEDFIFKVEGEDEDKEFVLVEADDEIEIVSQAYYEL